MSEPVLYRIDLRPGEDRAAEAVQELKDSGVFVPVEPCEHGNIDRHVVRGNPSCLDCGPAEWCPGADLGGSDG